MMVKMTMWVRSNFPRVEMFGRSHTSCADVEMNEKARLVSLEVSRLFFRVVTLEIRLKKAAFTDFARPWLVLRGGHLRTR